MFTSDEDDARSLMPSDASGTASAHHSGLLMIWDDRFTNGQSSHGATHVDDAFYMPPESPARRGRAT